MDKRRLTQLLVNAQARECDIRTDTEEELRYLQLPLYSDFLYCLVLELSHRHKPIESRELVARILKNIVVQRWRFVNPPTLKHQIQSLLLNNLLSDCLFARSILAQLIANIAVADYLEHKEFLQSLLFLREGGIFEVLGYLFEELSLYPNLVQHYDVDMMIEFVAGGMHYNGRHYETIRMDVMTALLKSASFAYENLATQNHIRNILFVTRKTKKEEWKSGLLLLLRFWMNLCNEEQARLDSQLPCLHLIRKANPNLLRILIQLMPYIGHNELGEVDVAAKDCLCLVACLEPWVVYPVLEKFTQFVKYIRDPTYFPVVPEMSDILARASLGGDV